MLKLSTICQLCGAEGEVNSMKRFCSTACEKAQWMADYPECCAQDIYSTEAN